MQKEPAPGTRGGRPALLPRGSSTAHCASERSAPARVTVCSVLDSGAYTQVPQPGVPARVIGLISASLVLFGGVSILLYRRHRLR